MNYRRSMLTKEQQAKLARRAAVRTEHNPTIGNPILAAPPAAAAVVPVE